MKKVLELVKGQNVPLDPEVKSVRMTTRWTARGDGADVDQVALIVGADRRVRSDADMIFYNQPSTADGSVVHAGKVLGGGRGSDDVSVDIASLGEDVTGVTVAASTDGSPFGEFTELEWCVIAQTGEPLFSYRVGGLTSERALVLGELYRRNGCWRIRAVGQGWDGGLAGLATDYGVNIAADDSDADSHSADEYDITEPSAHVLAASTDVPDEVANNAVSNDSVADDLVSDEGDRDHPQRDQRNPESGTASGLPWEPREPNDQAPREGAKVVADRVKVRASEKVRIATAKAASVPVMRLAEDKAWQPSRLFSVSGIGGVDEQEKRATSALLWTMSAVRPLGRALTARAAAPAGVVETYLEVGFPLGENRVIPDGVIRIARGGRVWTGLVEVKTGDAVLQREQLENYLRLARRRKYDVVLTISNEISMDPGIHPVTVSGALSDKVALVHLSWSEVYERRDACSWRITRSPTPYRSGSWPSC